jgi:alkyl hydroperoxide reductase subunit AhpC
MRFLSTIILAVLLFSISLNFCVLKPVGVDNETTIAIDVCKGNTSIIAHSVDSVFVHEEPVMVNLEKQDISYIPKAFSLITYNPDPPDKPPRV